MKKRIIPSILIKGGSNVCLSKEFSPWRTIGALTQVLRLHVQRGADELLLINLDAAGLADQLPSQRIFSIVRNEVDIPISYAGGITSPESAIACINSGFDKVYLTSTFLDQQDKIQSISKVIELKAGHMSTIQKVKWTILYLGLSTIRSKNTGLESAIQMACKYGAGEGCYTTARMMGRFKASIITVQRVRLGKLTLPILLGGGAAKQDDFSTALSHLKIQESLLVQSLL